MADWSSRTWHLEYSNLTFDLNFYLRNLQDFFVGLIFFWGNRHVIFFQFTKAIVNCYSNPFFISVIAMEFYFFDLDLVKKGFSLLFDWWRNATWPVGDVLDFYLDFFYVCNMTSMNLFFTWSIVSDTKKTCNKSKNPFSCICRHAKKGSPCLFKISFTFFSPPMVWGHLNVKS